MKNIKKKSLSTTKSISQEYERLNNSHSSSEKENEKKRTTESSSMKSKNQTKYKRISMTDIALESIGLDSKQEGLQWESKWESLSAIISFIICSGNLWFFPFSCSFYGGFFPYQFTICYIFLAVPLLYMEIALGQFASASPLSVFSRMVPAMAGVSAGMSFLLVFKTISLAVWTAFDLVILFKSIKGFFSENDWDKCPNENISCLDYNQYNCLWLQPNITKECDSFHRSLIMNRGEKLKKSPFMTYIYNLIFEQSANNSEWTFPSFLCLISSIILWIFVGIVSISGSKTMGKIGIVTSSICIIGTLFLLIFGLFVDDQISTLIQFFYPREMYSNIWKWIWSWADASAYALKAVGVGCGGIQKLSSLNKFHSNIHLDVLIISLVCYFVYMTTSVYSFLFVGELGRKYYPSALISERIETYLTPMIVKASISEIVGDFPGGSLLLFIFWLTLVICRIQGLSSYIWIISSMTIERLNASKRKYGQPLTSWTKRTIIVSVMTFLGLISSLSFFGNGGINLMSTFEMYSSYAVIFIAFVELITVSYFYGFKRFSVNIRTMIGGRGVINIFWLLNWVFIGPVFLFIIFGFILATFHRRESFFGGHSLDIEILGWCLLCISIVFVVSYFIRKEVERRMNKEPFSVLIQTTGDWGPINQKNRKESQRMERASRVRY